MKKVYIAVLFIILFGVSLGYSEVGIGVFAGEPVGISLQLTDLFGGNHNFGIKAGYSWFEDIIFTADYWIIHTKYTDSVYWYFGGGVKMFVMNTNLTGGSIDTFGMGLRFPFGFQWNINNDWQLFVEVVPGILFLPEVDFDESGIIGVHYLFSTDEDDD